MVLNHVYSHQTAGGRKRYFNPADVDARRARDGTQLLRGRTRRAGTLDVVHEGLGKMSKSEGNGVDPRGPGRALRRRHRAPVHDVRLPARADARVVRRGRAGRLRASSAACGPRCTSTSRAGAGAAARGRRAQRRAARAAARWRTSARQGDRRHRPPPQLQHRDRRGHGAAERRRSASTDASAQARAVRQEALEIAVLVLAPITPHVCHALWQALGKRTRAHR